MSKKLDAIERKIDRIEQALSTINHILLHEVLPALRQETKTEQTVNLFVAALPQRANHEDKDISFYDISAGSPLSIDDTSVHSNIYVPPTEPNKATARARKIQARAKAV